MGYKILDMGIVCSQSIVFSGSDLAFALDNQGTAYTEASIGDEFRRTLV